MDENGNFHEILEEIRGDVVEVGKK